MKNNSLISLRSLVHFIQEKINVETFHVFSSGSKVKHINVKYPKYEQSGYIYSVVPYARYSIFRIQDEIRIPKDNI